MTSKRKTLISRLTCILFVMVLCFAPVTAFADPPYSSGTDYDNPATAAITKIFKMPADVDTPTATFSFAFTAVDFNEQGTAGMKTIAPAALTFGEVPDTGTIFVNGDVRSVVKEVSMFSGLPSDPWANGEGIYRYQVEESVALSSITSPGRVNEGTEFSVAKYDIEFWVERDSNGLFVKYVQAKKVVGYIDEYYDGYPGDDKVDPTEGGVNTLTEVTIEDDFSQVIFTNKYWGSDGGGDPDPEDAAFAVNKVVTGNGAVLTDTFDFNVTVTQPSLITQAQTYKAYVQELVSGTWTNVGSLITFASGVQQTGITLTNGQRLAFIDLHVAAKVEVWEDASANYTPKYSRTFANGTAVTPPVYTGSKNSDWGFPRDPGDAGPHIIPSGTNVNIATFTNMATDIPPSGISVDNLPFVLMIAIGFIALGGFIALKSRRRTGTEV